MSKQAAQVQNSLALADKSIHAQLTLYSLQAHALQSVYLGRIQVKMGVLLSPSHGPVASEVPEVL